VTGDACPLVYLTCAAPPGGACFTSERRWCRNPMGNAPWKDGMTRAQMTAAGAAYVARAEAFAEEVGVCGAAPTTAGGDEL